MKKLSLIFFLFGTLGIAASAQERETTMAELSPRIMKSSGIQAAAPYKSVVETERFDRKGGKLLDKTRITQEVVSPSMMRSLNEYPTDKSRPSVEHINVGGVKYERIAGQGWKLITRIFTVVGSSAGTANNADRIPIQSKQVNKVFFVGSSELDGQNATIYDVRVTETRTYASGVISEAFTNTRYWFADNGAIMKRLTETDDIKNGIYAVSTIRFSYENIIGNIEIPILDSVTLDK